MLKTEFPKQLSWSNSKTAPNGLIFKSFNDSPYSALVEQRWYPLEGVFWGYSCICDGTVLVQGEAPTAEIAMDIAEMVMRSHHDVSQSKKENEERGDKIRNRKLEAKYKK